MSQLYRSLLATVNQFQFHPKYQDVLDHATANTITHPSNDVKILQNAVMQSLDDEGILGLLDIFHLLINDSGGEFSGINWADVSTAYVNLSGTFLSNDGIIFSDVKNTGFNMLTDSINYQSGNCCWFYKLGAIGGNNIGAGDYPMNCDDGSNKIRNTAGTLVRINTNHISDWNYPLSTEDPRAGNPFNVFYQNGTNNRYYKNGNLIASATKAADAIPNADLLYATNSGAYSNVHKLFGTSGLLTPTQIANFNTIIGNYETAIALL